MTEENEPVDHAAMFRSVATKIDTNKDNGFAGAFVIAPPDGEPLELLLLNNASSPAMFWSLVKSAAEMAIDQLAQDEHQALQGGGRQRR